MEEQTEKEEFREFLEMIQPMVDHIEEFFECTRMEAFQAYLLLGVVSEIRSLRSDFDVGTFPMGSLSPQDVELFMETIGAKPN